MRAYPRIAAGLAAVVLALGVTARAGERILDYHSDIMIGGDGGLTVTETIRVEADGTAIKHGIYRDFPQLYRGRWGLRARVGFDVLSVQRDSQAEPYHTKRQDTGQRVYIGSESTLVPPGVHTYVLTYRTDRQLGFFAEHDELYWNVTGNGWAFPIDRASARVVLPPGARARSLEAYTGAAGARGKDYAAGPAGQAEAEFHTTAPLAPGEGLTIVVTWPKGFVAAPGTQAMQVRLLLDNPGLVLGILGVLLVLVYYVGVWVAVGKDPQRGVIIPLYEPPKGFSPAAVRYLMRMGFDNVAFTAQVLSLAVKGALRIAEESGEYTLHRRDDTKAELAADESTLLRKLFERAPQLRLRQTNHLRVSEAKKALQTALRTALETHFFVRNSRYWVPGLLFSVVPMGVSLLDASEPVGAVFMLVWLSFWTIGVTLLISATVGAWRGRHWGGAVFLTLFSLPFLGGEVAGVLGLMGAAGPWVGAVFAVGVLMNGVFYHLLKAPTFAGRKVLDQIEGFRMYLGVAEKDRLQAMRGPERTPELFDRFLPYALAMGVEQQWAEQFAGVLRVAGTEASSSGYTPGWYSGRALAGASLAGFSSALGSSLGAAISSSSTAPGSSSGSGGGGSSGGGGGGGGGGGW